MKSSHKLPNQKIIESILSVKPKTAGKKADSHFEVFVREFYHGVSEEFLSSRKAENLSEAAHDLWQFIQNRGSGKFKVRVHNPSWDSQRSVLEILVDDSPFLIDSISATLNQLNLRIYQIIHPALKVSRDKSGVLQSIANEKNKDGSGTVEAIMHFQISFIADKKEQQFVQDQISYALEAVGYAVQDWKPMLAVVQDTVAELENAPASMGKDNVRELQEFFRWVADNHFTFLGICDYDLNGKKTADANQITAIEKSALGIFRMHYPSDADAKKMVKGTETLTQTILPSHDLVNFSKSNRKSIIHRPVHMDYIGIKLFDKKGNIIGERRFLGLYTSSVYYQSATLIPIIRKKMDYVLNRAGFKPTSHDGKELVTILENYPRDEVFQINQEQLFDICIGVIELAKRPRVRMFVRMDKFNRFASSIVYIPRERFNTQVREKIQAILERSFKGSVIDHYTQVTDSPLARIHVIIKTDAVSKTANISDIEKQILEVTNSWVDGLRETLVNFVGEREGEQLFREYGNAFPTPYAARYHFGGTYKDIQKIEEALSKNSLALDLYKLEQSKEEHYHLKIFHPESQVTLSNILPILENMGFHVIDELTFLVKPLQGKQTWVHHLRLRIDVKPSAVAQQATQDQIAYMKSIKQEFEAALSKIWHKEIEDDQLNMLVIKAGMKWREVALLRSFARYIHQTAFAYRYDFIAEALSNHPILSSKLFTLFKARFAPGMDKMRESTVKEVLKTIDSSLATVTNVAEDRVIRQCMDTIMATLRTNYFQTDEKGEFKKYISFKLDSQKAPDLPLPRPFVEIFVYSYEVEGIHLRGGKVARGGLRWSDRREDFRTEILGLMKAQMVKNAVIVPVGSKGGFVVKYPTKSGRDVYMAQGIDCYKTFLRGLLDITDNIEKGKVIPPKDVVRHDGDDPYLVVAADKGTASFSDIANGVSEEYGFWLADAFASGGSAGYDHKKMAITARGGWVSVERHFMEMGVDIRKEEFTVVGIGDMSGDVFGNGMLLSKNIRLVAAFNHMHIFLDPNPDAAKSFKERERLFNKPRSTWADYDAKLISEGGGIFERSAKSIPLSKAAQKALGTDKAALAPEELIKTILKAPVDLLWNGGIGTYVKATNQSNEEVGDKSSDAVRVNGQDLRCKIVGEGGNLGFTQLGRIEYALKGGRLNTDAIDNSAGVDCSDHEVNIKIALRKAVEKKKLNTEKRNELLAEMTDEVAKLVLRDNFLQTQAITVAQLQGPSMLEAQMRLMRALEQAVGLDRKIEYLPSDEAMAQRQALKQGLTRPELAVLLSYSKIAVYNDIVASNLPDDEYYVNDLKLYFPEAMRKKFESEIENHELRREIIATFVSNSIVNRMGSKFFFRMREDTGVKGCDIARSYTIARDAFQLRSMWYEIEDLAGKVTVEVQVKLFLAIKDMVERAAGWFLRNSPQPLKVAELVKDFAPGISEVFTHLDKSMTPSLKESCEAKLALYLSQGVPKPLATRISRLEVLSSACDIVQVTRKNGKLPPRIVSEVYYALGSRLHLEWLRDQAEKLPASSYWQKLSMQTMLEELFDEQRRITSEVIKVACSDDVCSGALDAWEAKCTKVLARYDDFLRDLKSYGTLDSSMLTVAIKRLKTIHASA
ncbi:MAG: NAD-glutamate dehydrogenase [Proteobacteria bacterium]|nr:NAD-glutamate dehydrogenase [Pseudomonadota bacterium]